jgi:uncharacterized protein (DUF983 family)
MPPPLSYALDNTLLSHPCPHCGHPRVARGSWFRVIPRYECEACREEVRMGYPDKVSLFERYLRSEDSSTADDSESLG